MIRKLLIIILFMSLSACVSVRTKYAGFGEYVANKKGVDVVVDSIFFSDLSGTTQGFNIEKNEFALQLITDSVNKALRMNGFEPNIAHQGHGVFFEPKAGVDYVRSTQWHSDGEQVKFPMGDAVTNHWNTQEVRDYLNSIISLGERESELRKNDKTLRSALVTAKPTSEGSEKAVDVPMLVAKLPSGLFIYVQVEGKIRSLSKKVGRYLTAGVISGLLTGGTIIAGATGDVYKMKIVAIDISTNKVVWHHERHVEGFKNVEHAARSAFEHYPLLEGRYLTRQEREDRKRTRTNRVKSK